MAKPPIPLALPDIDLEEKTLEVKLRLKGAAAVEVLDYQRCHLALKGKAVELEPMAALMIGAFIRGDKGFAAWRKAEAERKADESGSDAKPAIPDSKQPS